MEATMFALLAGCHNLGGLISDFFGAFVLQMLHVDPAGLSGEGVQFDNLWKASLISSLLPMLPILLINSLIPDSQQTCSLLTEHPESATVGSPVSRWLGREPPEPLSVATPLGAERA